MNTQCQASVKAMPYEIVFDIKPSSEPVADLTVVDEGKGAEGLVYDSDSDDADDNDDSHKDSDDGEQNDNVQQHSGDNNHDNNDKTVQPGNF